MRDIQIKAEEFRQNCKVIKYCIADLFDECERMGYRMIRYPIGEQGILGFAQIRDDDKIIFTNSSARLAREIFSVAHEIGHILLHINEEKRIFVDTAGSFYGNSESSIEQEANYFAACLLMPEDEVEKYVKLVMDSKDVNNWTALDIAQMMTAFNVSFEMALNRLQSLQKLNISVKKRLESQKNEMRVTKLLRMLGGNSRLNLATEEKKIPNEYLKWVIDNYNHKVIPRETLERALRYFEVDIEDIEDEITVEEEAEDDLDTLIGGMSD